MEGLLKIIKMGVYASIQDQGRFSYRRFGVPQSGPMDRVSHYYGNYILGNIVNSPSLEIFVGGFKFQALQDNTYVITGPNAECYVNGELIPLWKAFELKKDDCLEIKRIIDGNIIYLSALGGFANELILGSRSTYDLANMGLECREGTILNRLNNVEKCEIRGLYPKYIPNYSKNKIRVYKGPHFDLFDEESKELFMKKFQYIGGNRMGYYLKGASLKRTCEQDILSEATQFGSIQVMSNGQPVVLMADSQTIGGYPIIATIVEEDLPIFVQTKMFDEVQFEIVGELNGY
ncbi:5-oxoprolinase subunit C family protein [Ureibacillus thermosphaericus]|uniref:5-oxoprolinase subunit C family protein n=1 Tax=Ureibacillus thermosphaericus TaxID=51173 RepID=UPI000BBBC312|nr:biotin-dependent carboxyltransferase family protein [Ureibacillus thermosphaericus]